MLMQRLSDWRRWPQLANRAVRYSLAAAGYHTRPAFIVIGVQRGGTTSLFRWLCAHPQIVGDKKELHYFDLNAQRSLHWYHSHFPLPHQLAPGQITFEITPRYIYDPAVAQRIHRYDPDIRLVLVLRDPVERAISHWHFSRDGFARLGLHSFAEAVEHQIGLIERNGPFDMRQKPTNLIDRGFYALQLQRYDAFFDRDQIHICDYSDLKHRPAELMDELVAFLGLPPHRWDAGLFKVWNQSRKESAIDDASRQRLSAYYASHNQALFDLLGREFDWS